MTKQLLVLLICSIFILSSAAITAQNEVKSRKTGFNNKNKLVGIWKKVNSENPNNMVFKLSNNKMYLLTEEGKYLCRVTSDSIIVLYPDDPMYSSYTISNDTLNISTEYGQEMFIREK